MPNRRDATFPLRPPKMARGGLSISFRDAGAVMWCHTVRLVLREVKQSWDADQLGPLLADTRTWGWTYAVEPGKDEPRRPIRVCDEAAVTLSYNNPELKFIGAGEHADLDRQIAAIRIRASPEKVRPSG